MRIEEFDYALPEELIAQEPAPRRDAARLLVLDRREGALCESTFDRLGDFLRAGDLLVVNDTRVFPARLRAVKPTGGALELLLLGRDPAADRGDAAGWRSWVSPARGLRPGVTLAIAPGFEAEIVDEPRDGTARIRLRWEEGGPDEAIRRHGLVPLPPYIARDEGDPRSPIDRERYQTVFARHEGAVAAPTAGLHFTPGLIDALRGRGVQVARLTLHVGPGTFRPVRAAEILDHVLDPEAFLLPPATAEAFGACRARGGRVIAVGTTVTRVLEDRAGDDGGILPGEGRCGLYITPGHRFRAVDALITNFHLPRSSLLILVAAFAGRERILAAYREAVARRFRFYSYGDAMLIL